MSDTTSADVAAELRQVADLLVADDVPSPYVTANVSWHLLGLEQAVTVVRAIPGDWHARGGDGHEWLTLTRGHVTVTVHLPTEKVEPSRARQLLEQVQTVAAS